MWRHQTEHQWESSKNFRTPPFRTGSKNIYFDHYSDFYMSICKGYMNSFSQNSMWRSGNWQKVKNFRTLPFEEYWLNLLFFGLLSLNVEFPRVYKPFWCLSVDESCDTVKNIFSSLTVLIWGEILEVNARSDTSNWSIYSTQCKYIIFVINESSNRKFWFNFL